MFKTCSTILCCIQTLDLGPRRLLLSFRVAALPVAAGLLGLAPEPLHLRVLPHTCLYPISTYI